jgi:hypothetical protein
MGASLERVEARGRFRAVVAETGAMGARITWVRKYRYHPPVMAGVVQAIHDFRGINELKSWVAGPSPAMTCFIRLSRFLLVPIGVRIP